MSIIIEGPDNSGKSTLCGKLSELTGMDIKWAGGPPKDVYEAIDSLNRMVGYIKDNCNLDRCFPIGELVYGVCIREKSLVSMATCKSLIGDTRIVYCRPRTELILNFDSHNLSECDTAEHLEKVKTNAEKILNKYDEVMEELGAIRFDYEKDDCTRIL
jgi:hypothetical protein